MQVEYLRPNEIEVRSFEIIDEELSALGKTVPSDTAFVVKRAIHTTADFDYADTLYFSEGALDKIYSLINAGAYIVTDTNMALAGINKTALNKLGINAICYMADPHIANEAQSRGVTRAIIGVEYAAKLVKPVIFVVGNAPTALMRLKEMYDEGTYTPSFIIGVPVGFVNVEIAKNMIINTDIPCIINRGRKGGSTVAAAIVNAVLYRMGGRE